MINIRDKLRLVFCEYGLGKYYIYNQNGHKYPFIQMNINMYHYDKELFLWVLAHEMDHYVYFQENCNEGKKDLKSELKQCWPSFNNIKMVAKQAKFELMKKNKAFGKGFAVVADPDFIYEPQLISYFECKHKLSKEQEEEIVRFVGKVKDL